MAAPKEKDTHRRLRALIAEDDDSMRTLLRAWLSGLEEFEMPPLEAADGRTALEHLRLEGPDLLLLDLVMPGSSGFFVLGHLGTLPRRPRVIVISRVGNERLLDQLFQMGVDFFFRKPVNLNDLTGVIRLLFGTPPVCERQYRGPAFEILSGMGAPSKLMGTMWASRLAEALAAEPEGDMLLKEAYYAVRRPGDSAYMTVDKNIRDLIQRLHRSGSAEYQKLWSPSHDRAPTCGEFLHLLAEEVRRRCRQSEPPTLSL